MTIKTRSLRARVAIILLAALLAVSVAWAGPKAGSADEAAAVAREATGGRVLSVEPAGRGNKDYRVKVLDDNGRVRTIHVEGRNERGPK